MIGHAVGMIGQVATSTVCMRATGQKELCNAAGIITHEAVEHLTNALIVHDDVRKQLVNAVWSLSLDNVDWPELNRAHILSSMLGAFGVSRIPDALGIEFTNKWLEGGIEAVLGLVGAEIGGGLYEYFFEEEQTTTSLEVVHS